VANVAEAPEEADLDFLQQLLDTRGPKSKRAVVHDVVWGSRFLTRHAVASSYRTGRIVLAGDAAHVHSPLGGQGMNLGINDAVTLGQALSEILQGRSPDLLDSYNAVQRRVAERVITATDLLTKVATMPEHFRRIRNLMLVAFSPLISRLLARRLSLLDYLKDAPESPRDKIDGTSL
jgi:2-polyprenyl-6-methoxyphenol hydroxylase-like FAD-dependent oxidoreductase